MGLFEKLRNELVDIIEWVDDSRHALVWRFPRYQNEIKNGAQLIVRPGQTAVFGVLLGMISTRGHDPDWVSHEIHSDLVYRRSSKLCSICWRRGTSGKLQINDM